MTVKHLPSGVRLSNDSLYKSINLLQLKDIFELELAKYMHYAQQSTLYLPSIIKCLPLSVRCIGTLHLHAEKEFSNLPNPKPYLTRTGLQLSVSHSGNVLIQL